MCGRGSLAGRCQHLEKQSRGWAQERNGSPEMGILHMVGLMGYMCVSVCGWAHASARALSHVCLFVIPRTVACQATLSMELFKPHKCQCWVLTRVRPSGVTMGSRWMIWWLVFLAYSQEDLLIPGFWKASFAFQICCRKYSSSSWVLRILVRMKWSFEMFHQTGSISKYDLSFFPPKWILLIKKIFFFFKIKHLSHSVGLLAQRKQAETEIWGGEWIKYCFPCFRVTLLIL